MKNYSSGDIINVGTGEDVTIKELTEKISEIVGFKGKIVWDTTKPDGAPRRLLDVDKLHTLGWKHSIELEKGLKETYEWFKKNVI
jgi:GDP-L-fucose synthase